MTVLCGNAARRKAMKKLPAHERSSGNVFADLGLPDADELLLKSQIVMELARLMKRKKLSQSVAAAIAGVAQPDLSNLLRGKLRGFSVERLLRMLTAFGRDVDIVVRPARRARARGGIKITSKVA
jgi:predicted XRE-type DNA-binding protein